MCINLNYLFYSASDSGTRLKYSDTTTITSSSFDSSKNTRIIINDWYTSSSNNYDWVNDAKSALFAKKVNLRIHVVKYLPIGTIEV